MQSKPLYKALASRIVAAENCRASGNLDWQRKHEDAIARLAKEYLPSGSGFDSGSTIDADSRAECIVIRTAYHHMHDSGMYDGWTEHTVRVRPSLLHDFCISISGRDRNGIKEYMRDVFADALHRIVQD